MLDADEIGYGDEDEEGDETAEPRPVFAVEVTNKKGKMASFLCMITPEAALQIVKVSCLVNSIAMRTTHLPSVHPDRVLQQCYVTNHPLPPIRRSAHDG